MPRDPFPTRALVQAQRVGVVVRRDEPESLPSRLACVLDDAVEERGARARAPVRGRDRDELGIAFDFVPERTPDRATVPLADEPVELGCVLVDPTTRYDARRDELRTNDVGDPGAVVLAYAADLHPASSLHRTRFLQCSELGVTQAEHAAQRPLVVLTERGPGRLVAARTGREPAAVAFVAARTLDRVRVRLEVATVRELGIVVEVGEVVDGHRLDARPL